MSGGFQDAFVKSFQATAFREHTGKEQESDLREAYPADDLAQGITRHLDSIRFDPRDGGSPPGAFRSIFYGLLRLHGASMSFVGRSKFCCPIIRAGSLSHHPTFREKVNQGESQGFL